MREEIGQRGVGQKKKQKMMENGRVIEKKKCEESVVSDINMRRSEHVVENEELRRIKGKEKVSSGRENEELRRIKGKEKVSSGRENEELRRIKGKEKVSSGRENEEVRRIKGKEKVSSGRENEEVKRQKTNKNGQLTTKTTRKGIKSVKGDANGDVSNIGSAATSAEEDGSLDLVCKIYEQLWKRYQYGNEKVYVKGFTAEQIMYQMKDLIDHVVKEAEKKMDECEGDGVYDEHSSNACSSSDPCDKRCANDSDAHESSSEEDESTDENDGTAVHKIDSYQTSLDVLKALDAATKSEYELDEEIESTHNGVTVTTHSTPAQTITSIKFNNTFSLSTICDIKPLTNQQIYIIPEYGNESVARVVYNGLRAYKPIILCSTRFACGLKYVKSGMYVVLCEMCELHDFECYAVLDDKCERVVVVDVEKGRAIVDSTNENVVKYYQMRYGTVEVRKTGGVMMNDEECAQRLSADNAALCGVTAGDREQNMENIVNGPVASALKDAVERKDGAMDEKSKFGSGANRTDVTAKHSSDCQPIGEEGLVKHTGNDHEPCGCTPGTGQTRTKSTTVTPHNTERAHSFTTEFDRVKFLVSRLSRVEKVKHLNIFGIYFTNFKLEQFAYKIKEYLVSRGKKVYMYYLRDISYERLTCMDGIECVVIVDCRYHTRFDINIGMPIVVPFELNLAFDGERWDGAYDVNTFNDAGADGNECTDMIACDYYSTGELIKRNEDQCVNFYVEQFDDRIHDGLDGIAGSYKQMGER